MSIDQRLAALYAELMALGLPCLVMGGHAVRFYGVDRSTADFDIHVALDEDEWKDLDQRLASSTLIANNSFREGVSWRPGDFRRFVVGTLPDGREERLEFWRRNHLLAPFSELWERREEGAYGGRNVAFLGLADLIRSKETEREDDWRDIGLLEQIADERRLHGARDPGEIATALAGLRSRQGFEQAMALGVLSDINIVRLAMTLAPHPLACQASLSTG